MLHGWPPVTGGFAELPLDDERWPFVRAVIEQAERMRSDRVEASYRNYETVVHNAVVKAIGGMLK